MSIRTVTCASIVFAAMTIAASGAPLASASISSPNWKPGAPEWVTEKWTQSLVEEQVADFASCRGIVRYGHRFVRGYGDEYLRFECKLENTGKSCTIQYKSVNTPEYGIGTLKSTAVYACDRGFRGSGR
jgi:hypothetical protein